LLSRLAISNLKDVEIFYLLNPRSSTMLDYLTPDDMEALDKENRNLKEIDYT